MHINLISLQIYDAELYYFSSFDCPFSIVCIGYGNMNTLQI